VAPHSSYRSLPTEPPRAHADSFLFSHWLYPSDSWPGNLGTASHTLHEHPLITLSPAGQLHPTSASVLHVCGQGPMDNRPWPGLLFRAPRLAHHDGLKPQRTGNMGAHPVEEIKLLCSW
jgi:hypothetical protein